MEGAFGAEVDYAQLVKLYGAAPDAAKGRYSPADCTGIRKTRVEGKRYAGRLGAPIADVDWLNPGAAVLPF